jgi:hypothetical protein
MVGQLRRLGRPVEGRPRAPKDVREGAGWYRHARMLAVGAPLLLGGYLVADDGRALAVAAGIWIAILVVDFLVSFSYSVGGGRDRRTAAG